MEHSKQQLDIYNEFKETKNNLLIAATAGAGKTTTLLEISKLIPTYKKTIFLAFNKSIAEELRGKLPEHVEVATIHSKGYSVLRKNMRMNTKLNEIKNYINAMQCIKGRKFRNENEKRAYMFLISDIVTLMKLNLVNSGDEDKIEDLCNAYGIDILNGEIQDAVKLYDYTEKINYNTKEKQNIDFTDMLYLTYTRVDPLYYPKYDYILLDEVQDINILQREFVMKMKKKTGRIVSVGDEKQTIYSFQGSNLDSFNYLKNMDNTTCLPLSVTYRCAVNIVNEAKKVFDDIEAKPGAENGVVRKGGVFEAESGDFIICRNNLPLFRVFIMYMKKGKKAVVVGKDFQKNLLNLVRKIDSVDDLEEIKQNRIKTLQEKGVKRPTANPSYVELCEKIDIIKMMVREFGSLNKTTSIIEGMFGDETDKGVKLSTIHKAKGLEADRVFFLNKELIPSEYATTAMARYSEKCLKFVAITRARKELVYCNI